MTTKPVALSPAPPLGEFPDPPPREDMQNINYLHKPSHLTALELHFVGRDAIVTGEVPLGWRAGRGVDFVVPDLLIAFDADSSVLKAQNGYCIHHQGKPPDFVLEIASKTTSGNDESGKRGKYAGYGVPEYWRFDDTGGDYYQAALAGDRLEDGEYQPVPVMESSWARIRGYSAALNLYICWEYGYLRFYDPARQRYLPSHQEEQAARLAAEAERDAAEARSRELEAEIRRLRGGL